MLLELNFKFINTFKNLETNYSDDQRAVEENEISRDQVFNGNNEHLVDTIDDIELTEDVQVDTFLEKGSLGSGSVYTFKLEMFYLNTIEQLFLFAEQ